MKVNASKHNKISRTDFYTEVYKTVSAIPYGKVTTYGQIAYLLGQPQCSRLVGQAMSQAPASLQLPCHRVVNSQGRLVPGWLQQYDLLVDEGVCFRKNGYVNLKISGLLVDK